MDKIFNLSTNSTNFGKLEANCFSSDEQKIEIPYYKYNSEQAYRENLHRVASELKIFVIRKMLENLGVKLFKKMLEVAK